MALGLERGSDLLEGRGRALLEKGLVIARGQVRPSTSLFGRAPGFFDCGEKAPANFGDLHCWSGPLLETRDVDAVALEGGHERSAVGGAGAGGADVDDAVANEGTEGIHHRAHAEIATAFNRDRQLRDRTI